MKERPILFSAPMVRALLDGSKTQTRRIMKPQPEVRPGSNGKHWWPSKVAQMMVDIEGPTGFQGVGCEGMAADFSPYGSHGDRLWVRETFSIIPDHDEPAGYSGVLYKADGVKSNWKWRPSIHMFRADSRILLEIVNVRVERLNDCSEPDARAEGIEYDEGGDDWPNGHSGGGWRNYLSKDDACDLDPKDSYKSLWEQINGAGSWAANPWVWVVEFKRVLP